MLAKKNFKTSQYENKNSKSILIAQINSYHRRRSGGAGGHCPPGWCKVSKFSLISYILGDFASNFGRFHIFRANFASKFWAKNFFRGDHLKLHRKTVSMSVKTFFLRLPQFGQVTSFVLFCECKIKVVNTGVYGKRGRACRGKV